MMKKIGILLLFAILAIFQTQATTEEINFALQGFNNGSPVQVFNSSHFYMTFVSTTYYDQGKALRIKGSVKIRSKVGAISKIVCTFVEGHAPTSTDCIVTLGDSSYYTNSTDIQATSLTWTGHANIIMFGHPVPQKGSSTNLNTWYLKKMTITYGDPEVAAPTFSPEGGEYTDAQHVTIASKTQGATISYSTDGGANWNTYQSPITVTQGTTTIRAKAIYNNTESKIATATYKILPATVTLKDLMKKGSGAFDVADASMQAITRVEDKTAGRYYVQVKDADGASIERVEKTEGLINYKVNGHDQTAYDQSNWMLVEVSEQDYAAFDKACYSVTSIAGGLYNGDPCDPVVSHAADGTMPVITYGDKATEFTPNQYCPVNFMTSYSADYSGNGAQGSNGTASYFFMSPKAQEYATVVWAVWDQATSAFYVPAPDGVNNVHGFYGKFEVALDYNDGDVTATTDLADQAMYSFPAVVKKLTAQQSAARKVKAHTGGGTAQPGYIVYPVELNKQRSVVTAVSDVHSAKTVERVSYYNVAGARIAAPQPGVNIVVTTYTDGTTRTSKLMNR